MKIIYDIRCVYMKLINVHLDCTPKISIFNLLCVIAIVSNSKESIVNDGNRQTWLNLEITST